jgi:hypothetical protein
VSNRYIWIGITIGVFFAGIGIGYLVYTNTYNPVTMMQNQQFMQKMMQDPQFHQQMMSNIVQNPQMMSQWMGTMMQNQQFQQNWMGPWMMNDTNWRGMMSNIQK